VPYDRLERLDKFKSVSLRELGMEYYGASYGALACAALLSLSITGNFNVYPTFADTGLLQVFFFSPFLAALLAGCLAHFLSQAKFRILNAQGLRLFVISGNNEPEICAELERRRLAALRNSAVYTSLQDAQGNAGRFQWLFEEGVLNEQEYQDLLAQIPMEDSRVSQSVTITPPSGQLH
jgi:hypothetical protein